ncbi:hypothetical protein AKJ62_02960 [candidate division MSBL1 archaeon SCGC-AAA259D14]|uniref:Uncharacterized protein n=1 Tax=candidate division MSBL1 archaeon SCGC-AAA259D14 TaxID=1698261 RepID=A0A133U5R3_9EURY|nr:hypothetical protein AKJ62_02960 [candidate division MSBL1 archaeon SCGC-AAA259D14]
MLVSDSRLNITNLEIKFAVLSVVGEGKTINSEGQKSKPFLTNRTMQLRRLYFLISMTLYKLVDPPNWRVASESPQIQSLAKDRTHRAKSPERAQEQTTAVLTSPKKIKSPL